MTDLPKPPSLAGRETFDARADAFLAERAAGVAEWVAYTLERLMSARKEGEGDPERAHGDADEALCDFIKALGHPEIVEAWEAVDKWYA